MVTSKNIHLAAIPSNRKLCFEKKLPSPTNLSTTIRRKTSTSVDNFCRPTLHLDCSTKPSEFRAAFGGWLEAEARSGCSSAKVRLEDCQTRSTGSTATREVTFGATTSKSLSKKATARWHSYDVEQTLKLLASLILFADSQNQNAQFRKLV